MKILAINAGSSSLKWQLLAMPAEEVIAEGVFERIGVDGTYSIKYNGEKFGGNADFPTHKEAVQVLLDKLLEEKIISSFEEIVGCGHRIVHGGEKFTDSTLINDEVEAAIEGLSSLAPLHNPAGIASYRAFKSVLPNIPHVAVFDTAFHQTMEKEAFTYAVPYEWYTEYGVRRYGFHGTSHKYVSEKAAEVLGKEIADTNVITCHIGNGCSIAAVKGGKVVDTSMGLTPLDGLVMGTRCGQIDPAIAAFMSDRLGKSAREIDNMFNKESGMKGLSGLSSDMRDIEDAIEAGNERAILANEIYEQKMADYIVKYANLLEGNVDAIIWTAGVGENGIDTRKGVHNKLFVLNSKIDNEANNVRGRITEITTADSSVKGFVIPTNEELMIVRDVVRVAGL